MEAEEKLDLEFVQSRWFFFSFDFFFFSLVLRPHPLNLTSGILQYGNLLVFYE